MWKVTYNPGDMQQIREEGKRWTRYRQYVLTQDTDGKYHWSYELNLFTNPTVLITVFKVFGGIVLCMGIWIGLLNGEPFVKTLVYIGQFWLYGLGFILVLISLGYLLYATVQGGKYCVVFEMDEKTVTHTQVAKQFRKAQVLAALAAFVGAVKGSLDGGNRIIGGQPQIDEDRFQKSQCHQSETPPPCNLSPLRY